MTYTDTFAMLRDARAGGYGIGAFNVENMEMVQAVVAAAEETRSPVMLQTTPGTLTYATLDMFAGMARAAAEQASVPVALHLDHGSSFDLVAKAVRAGYSSVMFDGSQTRYAENLRVSKQVTAMCRPMNVPVELELGTVGGKEDLLDSKGIMYTEPQEAVEFVEAAQPDSLAVAIGTAHGPYKGEPKLDLDRLSAIAEAVSIPLVLHGSSGLSDEVVQECVNRGAAKVNFATELRQIYTASVRKFLTDNPEAFDPKKFGAPARAAVQQLVEARMEILGSVGKA